MLCETTAVKPDLSINKLADKQTRLCHVVYAGISAVTDVALWEAPPYSSASDCTFAFLNLYGSESQLRGIFSAIATHKVIVIKKNNSEISLSRNWQSFLRYKSWKIGYGKYQALIWDETLLSECIVSESGKELEAWETFLKKRRVPLLREWIPDIIRVLKKEELIEELHGIGKLRGWRWMASDDEVCDLIVKEIFSKSA